MDFVNNLDIYISSFIFSHSYPSLLTYMDILTRVLSPYTIIIVGLLSIVFFIYKKKWFKVSVISMSLVGGYLLVFLLKVSFSRSRPISALIIEDGFSFPSGHAMAVTIFFTLLVYIFYPKIENKFIKNSFLLLSVIPIVLVAFSRIYLGVHWFSDIVSGVLIGLVFTVLIILLNKYLSKHSARFRDSK